MKRFAVWSEGYAATGESQPAQYHGTFDGETFADACKAWAATVTFRYPQWPDHDLFDAERLTYWGCRLYDNEADARRFNG